jgi:hypothetical protein
MKIIPHWNRQNDNKTDTEKPIYIQEVNIDYDTILAFN